jgi:hypothetical protein
MAFLPSDKWSDILNRLGSPFSWILTKEGYALINAFITSREFIILANFYQFLANQSVNATFWNILLKALLIRSIGAILINDKQVSLNALISALQVQGNMYIALVNVLNTLTNAIPSVAFNPIANAKWASVFSAVLVALASTGTEIGNLKNDIRTIINTDIFCIEPCTTFMRARLASSKVEDIRDSVKEIVDKLYERETKLWKEYGKDLLAKGKDKQ